MTFCLKKCLLYGQNYHRMVIGQSLMDSVNYRAVHFIWRQPFTNCDYVRVVCPKFGHMPYVRNFELRNKHRVFRCVLHATKKITFENKNNFKIVSKLIDIYFSRATINTLTWHVNVQGLGRVSNIWAHYLCPFPYVSLNTNHALLWSKICFLNPYIKDI